MLLFTKYSCSNDLKQSEGFKLEVTKIEYLENKLYVEYRILNTNNYLKQAPKIKITLLNENHQIIDSVWLKTLVSLKSHNYLYIGSQFLNVPKNINSFEVAI